MKIIKIIKGFTTNSSGSYEWLPTEDLSGQNQTSSTSSTTDPTQNNLKLNEYQFVPKNATGVVFLILSILSGLGALALISKEVIKKIKAKNKKSKN